MPERHDPYVSLRNRNFLWFVASLVAFTLGTQIQATVVAWQVYALTRDPLSLGLVGLAEALPFIGAALYAGHVADRHNRKHLSLLAIGVQTLAACILLGYTLRPAVLAGGRVWPIYAVVFLSGVARSFLQPARTALSAEIVPRETYVNAVAWRASLWQLAAVVGPAMGGMLYGFSGARAVLRHGGGVLPGRPDLLHADRLHAAAPGGPGREHRRKPDDRHPLPAYPAGVTRRAVAGPLLRALRRRDGAAADLRLRDPACRAARGSAYSAPLPPPAPC